MSDLIKRKSIRNMYSCLDPEDKVRVAQVLTDIDAIPSADTVSLEEFEQMRFLADKSMEMVGEERPKGEWTSVLAELHERFDALEKEIRKASAEMSAVIREYVDRPKGEQIATEAVCEVICKHCIEANGCCQHHWICPLLTEIAELIEPKDESQTEIEWWDCIDHRDMEHHVYCTPKIDESRYEPQTETDKDLKEARIAVARAKAFKTSDIDEPPTKCDLCKREGDDICIDCERKGVSK